MYIMIIVIYCSFFGTCLVCMHALMRAPANASAPAVLQKIMRRPTQIVNREACENHKQTINLSSLLSLTECGPTVWA